MKIFRLPISILMGLFLFGMASASVIAQGSTPPPPDGEVREVTDNEVNSIAREVYCPVCESTPLDVCQTQACADWRDLIRTKLENGETRQDVYDYFAEQYGGRVLATPPREGLNLLLWIMPVAAVIIGGFFFSRFMKNLRMAGGDGKEDEIETVETAVVPPSSSPIPQSDDEYIAQVERELSK